MKKIKVLFVCLGNICRSPTAHGIFREKVEQAGMSAIVEIESAGTSGWHIGEPPDKRTQAAALAKGYDLSDLKGRAFSASDFSYYDYILAMDEENLRSMQQLKPADYSGHLGLFLDFSGQDAYREVPDPYYGGNQGFQTVINLVEEGCSGLLEHIRKQYV